MSKQLLRVTEGIEGCHPQHPNYPLLPGDVLTLERDGTYMKHTGLGMFGFVLTAEQAARLEPVEGHIVIGGGPA